MEEEATEIGGSSANDYYCSDVHVMVHDCSSMLDTNWEFVDGLKELAKQRAHCVMHE